jgi:putative spermidine/putrescine transport system permease protein
LRTLSLRRDVLPVVPAVAIIVGLFGGALLGAVRTSVVPLGGSFSLEAWRSLLGDPTFVDAAVFTARTALLATVISASLALLLAVALRDRGGLVRAIVALPVPVPHLIAAAAAVVWLGPGGLAERLLGALPVQLVRDDAGIGIIAVYAWKEIPFLVLLLLTAGGPELRRREEAASVLGLTPFQRLRWVTWPALRGSLVVGAIIVAAYVIGSFEVPLIVGPNHPPVLATFALEATQGDAIAGQGRAAAALLVATAASVLLASVAVRAARDVEGR